jgi:hypothetical protein
MNIERATPELFAALADAQFQIENASKNAANPHFRSRYADLAEVLNTVRPVLAKHGLSVMQSTAFDGAMVSVETVLAHSSGGSVSSTASCVPAKTDAQGVGAATTYLRRYALAAMAGVAQEDDDGNSAAHTKPAPVQSDTVVQDAMARIAAANDAAALGEVGAGLAKLDVDEGAKRKLRAAFTARRKALEAA